jgi:excisionase family DNA binding protein
MEKTKDVLLQPLLLNVSQVSKLLGLSRTTVYKLIDTEGLPVVRFGRAVRVRPTALQSWLEQRERGAVA